MTPNRIFLDNLIISMKKYISILVGLIPILFGLLFPWPEIIAEEKTSDQLAKDLENPEETIRTAAVKEIIGRGDIIQRHILQKATERLNNLIKEYEKIRSKIIEEISKEEKTDTKWIDTKWLDTKREKALKLFKDHRLDEMKKVVEEMWEKFYPKPPSVAERDEKNVLPDLACKIKILNDSLKQLGAKRDMDGDVLIKSIDEDSAEKFQCRFMPKKDLEVMVNNKKAKAELDIEEYRFVVMLNKYRVLMGKNAVPVNLKLCKAARGHSKDMKELGFFSHESPIPGKKTPQDRAEKEGTFCRVENIYRGPPKAEDAFWSWFGSYGHHENMLFYGTHIGIGIYGEFGTAMF